MGPEKEEEEEVYLLGGMGPELPDFWPNGPEFGPDLRDPLLCCEDEECLDEGFRGGGAPEGWGRGWWSPAAAVKSMPYIFPSSPDFLTSPPV